MVDVFFQLASKWLKWCAQTLHPFSQILKISSRIGAPIVAPPSDKFQISSVGKAFFPEKTLQTASKSAYKHRRYLLFNNATASLVTVKHRSVTNINIYKIKSEKHHISSSHADVCRAISTKFCMVIEVVCAIILGLKRFWLPSIVLPLGGVENLAENAPIEVNS